MPHVLAFSGPSDSGKTTFVSRIVSSLTERGLRVGLVKHHGHGGKPVNPPGKDSHTYLQAGAEAVVVTGAGEAAVFMAQPGDPGPRTAAAWLPEVDLVLAEGFKTRPGFKIELVSPGGEPRLTDDPLVLARAGRQADRPAGDDRRWLDVDDPDAAAQVVIDLFLPPDRLGPAPDRETCFALWSRYAMLPNIMIHSQVVTAVACRLAAALVRAGQTIDLPLVESGALLHDISKTECLQEPCAHGERGRDLALALGYPGVAEVIDDHIDPAQAERKHGLASPSVVVNYADKRVVHNLVVTMEERARDLVDRYGRTDQRKAWLNEIIAYGNDLERRLFDLVVDLEPGDLIAVNDDFKGVN